MKYIGKNRQWKKDVYHTDFTCSRATGELIPLEVSIQSEGQLRECKVCAGEVDKAQRNTFTCPYCGEEVKRFASHLPCDQ